MEFRVEKVLLWNTLGGVCLVDIDFGVDRGIEWKSPCNAIYLDVRCMVMVHGVDGQLNRRSEFQLQS